MSTREKRMSSGFHTECHRHFVSEAFSGGDGWTGRAAMGPYHTDSVRLSVIEPLTSRHEYVSNVVDRYASPIFRGPQDRRTARRRCAPSASAERARRGLRRRAGILRSPRPCPGEVRDAQTSPGRGTPGQHRGGCLRRQPTGLLHDRSGLRETRDSGAAAASAGAEAQSQVHRRGARLRRTASRRRCQRSAEHRRGGTAPIRVDHSPPLPGPSTGTAQKKIAGDGAPTGVKPAPVDARYVLEQYERLRARSRARAVSRSWHELLDWGADGPRTGPAAAGDAHAGLAARSPAHTPAFGASGIDDGPGWDGPRLQPW
jgi:hypothetical protein